MDGNEESGTSDQQTPAQNTDVQNLVGTPKKYQASEIKDTCVMNRKIINIQCRIQCVSAMKDYETKSLEELRFEDYQQGLNRKQQGGSLSGPRLGTGLNVSVGDTQTDVQQDAPRGSTPPDEVSVSVVKDTTITALAYATQDKKQFEMPCKINRPFMEVMNMPMTMLVGTAVAVVDMCKAEHFCCIKLDSNFKERDIQEWLTLYRRCTGIVIINCEDSMSLSDAAWEILSAHANEMTVAVISKVHGETLLKLIGSDMVFTPQTLTRFLYVKIFPKQSEFQLFKGQKVLENIPFQMHWRACSLTLDRVTCFQSLPNPAACDKAFLYLHTYMQQDTYVSIVMGLPAEVKNSKCLKGIMLLNCSSKTLGPMFWPPYMSNKALLPLYLVGVESGWVLLQKMQPQQPPLPGIYPLQAQQPPVPGVNLLQVWKPPVPAVDPLRAQQLPLPELDPLQAQKTPVPGVDSLQTQKTPVPGVDPLRTQQPALSGLDPLQARRPPIPGVDPLQTQRPTIPGVDRLQAQASEVHLNIPEAVHIRCVPVSGVLVTSSGKEYCCKFSGSVPLGQYLQCQPCNNFAFPRHNYRWLRLRPKETGRELLERIQKMQQVDGHTVGFIIGSTVDRSAALPKEVVNGIAQSIGDRETPPLIILKATDYDWFEVYTRTHSSLKEVKCLSDYGMLKVESGASPVFEVRCQFAKCTSVSLDWLPLVGARHESPSQAPYVRVLQVNDGKLDKDVLQNVQLELQHRQLNYVVMVSNTKKTVLVKEFDRSVAIVKLKDAKMLLQCVPEIPSSVKKRQPPESTSTIWQRAAAAGSQVLDWFVGGPSVKMALKLNTFDWSCNAKQSLCELGPELQHWSNVQDKVETLRILQRTIYEIGLKHFPLYVLVAMRLPNDQRGQLVMCLYTAAQLCEIHELAQIVTDFTSSGDLTLPGGKKTVCATMAEATEKFLDLQPSALFRIFWITLNACFSYVATGYQSRALWRQLTLRRPDCAKLLITVDNMKEMKKWHALAQHLKMDECQLSFDIIMNMIYNGTFQNFTIHNARILLSELKDVFFMEASRAQKVLSVLRAKQTAITPLDMKEGIKLLEDMLIYRDDVTMKNELLQWMEMLATFSSAAGVSEQFLALKTFAEKTGDANLQEEMLAAVKRQIKASLRQALRKVSLEEFAKILKGLTFLDCEISVEFFRQFANRLASVYSIANPAFSEVCNLALKSFHLSEPIHERIAEVLLKPLTPDITMHDKQKHLQTLLNLDIPKLFDIPASERDKAWLRTFQVGWKEFIQSKQMQVASQECFNAFLAKNRKEFTPYQKVVMKAFVPCIHIAGLDKSCLPEHPAFLCLGTIITSVMLHYDTVDKWKEKSVPPYNFFWEIIKNATLVVPLAERDVSWCQDWLHLIKLLVKVHCRFQMMIKEEPSKDLHGWFTDQNAKAYFNWVTEAQESLRVKAACFTDNEWSEEDASQFDSMKKAVVHISNCLHIDMGKIDTATLLQEANECRKKAIKVLFTCSHGKWVWLLDIMEDYAITPPGAISHFKTTVFKSESHYTHFVEQVRQHGQGAKEAIAIAEGDFKRDVPLRILKNVSDALEELMRPLQDCMEEMVFFHSRESHLFKQQMQLSLGDGSWPRSVKFEDFVTAVKSTTHFLQKFHCSQVTYVELKRLEFFRQRKAKKDSEIALLHTFYQTRGVESTDFLAQLKDMSNLLDALKQIPSITKVFNTFQMHNCTAHPSYQALVELKLQFSTEEQEDNLTGAEATKRMEEVLKIIHPLELPQLELFSVAGRSAEFYAFLKTIQQQGEGRFKDLHRLITQIMQHEEYNEAVLNQLPRAREYMLPFLDQDLEFDKLLLRIKAMCDRVRVLEDFGDLETINQNMNLIRLWFSKAEDHKLESVRKDLSEIMSTGIFLISEVQQSLSDSPGGCLLLKYQPSDDTMSDLWKEDAINDFSRRLGLLERSQGQADDMSEKVGKFHYNYKIARKTLQLWSELKSMRSPKATRDLCLLCSATKEAADNDLMLMKKFLNEWKQTLHRMRLDHPELCLFKIYKVFQMFRALQSSQIETLTQEMLLLFTDTHKTGLELVKAIQETLLQAKKDLAPVPGYATIGAPHAPLSEDPVTITDLNGADTHKENDPIEIIGQFLTLAFKLLKCHLPDLLTQETMPSGHGVLQPVVHKLKAVHCSQRDLLALLWSEYNRKKLAPFAVYRCHKGTTEEDLSLFFSRVQQFSAVFTLLDVNVLPLRLQEVIVKLHKEMMRKYSNGSIHYVVTGPSLMQDLPQVTLRMTDHDRAKSKWSQLEKDFHVQTNVLRDYSTVEIVYGRAGDGKSQYILKKLNSISSAAKTVTLTINESFSAVHAIEKLRQLPLQIGNGVYLNFTLLPASDSSSEQDKQAYRILVTRLQCFLFDLFFLGYVEDPQSGLSFSMPKGLKWHVYVEVPTREFRSLGVMHSDAYTLEEDRSNDPEKSLQVFLEEYPVLQLVGKAKRIPSNWPLDIDENAQLVCKYLQAYESRDDDRNGIDHPFRGHESEKVAFRSKPDCPKRECRRLLNVYMPKNAKLNKMNHFIFIRYMARRCMFLDMCPAYNYNEASCYSCKTEEGDEVLIDTSKLGSSLLESMLKEVDNLCSAQRRSTWGGSGDSRQQLVYVSDGMMEEAGGCFELVALSPDDIPEADREKFARLKVPINERDTLETRDCLDKYLSSAFGVMRSVVSEDGQEKMRLKEIDAKNYVLTLDFAMKMLELNERYHAGVPVIIEGETGVGKTFLVEMMADLWNSSLLSKWDRSLARLWTKVAELCKDILHCAMDDVSDEMKITALKIARVAEKQSDVEIKDLPDLCNLEIDEEELGGNLKTLTVEDVTEILKTPSLAQQLVSYMKKFVRVEPLLPLLEFSTDELKRRENIKLSFDNAMNELQDRTQPSLQVCGTVLFQLLKAAKPRVYFKKNIHGALTSDDMRNFMEPIVQRANEVMARWKNPATCPRLIVFLDEINTTSCPGLMKELLVDRSFHGKCLPQNVFIIGACNPHRSNSVAMHEKVEESEECDWVKGSYYVHRLHPTVRCLLWNYGALDEEQEERYIETKMKMAVSRYGSSTPLRGGTYLDILSSRIFESQCLVREFAAKHYETLGMGEEEAKELARSCVSQRDIQRVFTMYEWLLITYDLFQKKKVTAHKCYDKSETWQQRAILVALGLVYYFRLNKEFREEYKDRMEDICGDIKFTEALDDEMNFYCDTMRLPPGIAKTKALKENLFCIIACCCTKTPLIIVGEPGSSKTLSFNLAAAAFRGIESKIELFKNTDVFPGFDPYYYQCSRKTTSVEVETVFRRAVNRQKAHEVSNSDKFHCVVFMDEAGLPEESMESLKVLHKYLDDSVVSFVGITNHILDAAKSNRAVTLFRPRAADDVSQLAMGCFGLTESCGRHTKRIIDDLCDSYGSLVGNEKFTSFFGLRDFIHFVNHLRRTTDGKVHLLSHSEAVRTDYVIGSVQRNFNGHQEFDEVCKVFCNVQHSKCNNWKGSVKNLVQLLQESLCDRPFFVDQEDFEEIRYKLIIDPTEDDSSRRLIMEFHLLQPNEAKTLVGSDFPDDGDLQRINTIAEITHSASQGETVLMLQTDDIHESFYDLFNQHFRKIPVKGEGGKRTHFYANVAIGSHSKPCRVHPRFQCIVVIKESDLPTTPTPFLNRFEKYRLSPRNMLEAALDDLPRGLQVVVQKAEKEVLKLVNKLGKSSFCGMRREEDTVVSIFLDMVPKAAYNKVRLTCSEPITIDEESGLPSASLLKALLQALKSAGFSVTVPNIDKEWDIVCNLIKGAIPSIPHLDIAAVATDAWAALTSPDTKCDPQDQLVRFIQDLLCNWMYASAARKILQILTPEALILWRRSKAIPPWYFDSYLKHQHHFNLKKLITYARDTTQKRSSEGFTKVVCFTRSSQAVSQLTATGDTSKDEERVIEKIVVTSRPQRVKLCRMSTVSSQQEFSEQLAEFQASSEKDIMLIIANMHEATKKLINYVRLRIDEEEEKMIMKRHEMILRQKSLSASEGMDKKFLLDAEEAEHESSVATSEDEEGEKEGGKALETDGEELQISLSCHDETQEGDSQTNDGQSVASVMDIRDNSSTSIVQPIENQTKAYVLLLHFPPSVSQRACYPALFLYGWDYHYLDSLVASAECAIPVPLNEWCHVAFQQTAQGIDQERVAINWRMLLEHTALVMASRIALYDRSKVAISTERKADMFRNLLQGPLGQKLHDLYNLYWTPKNVAKFLQGAAVYARCRMSMISVTDVVQHFFESTLHNFLAYMLYHISEELGLDTYTDETKELFLALLDFVPRPKSLTDLKGYNNTWGVSSDVLDQLQACEFPGFSKICASIEACLRKRFDEMMAQESTQSMTALDMKELRDQLQEYANTRGQDRLKIALPYLEQYDALWERYETDFINFQFAVANLTKMKAILAAVISHSSSVGDSNLERLVALHYLSFSRHHDVAALEVVINPLQSIQADAHVDLSSSSVVEGVLIKGSEASQPDMAHFIIESLFGGLVNCREDSERLQGWQKTCRSILFTPNVERILYGNEYGEDYRGKFNVVQAAFLLSQCTQEDATLYKLLQCFPELLNTEQSVTMKETFTHLIDVQNTSSNNQNYVSHLCQHFFHGFRPRFYEDDILYFFQFVATLQFDNLATGKQCVTLGVLQHCMLTVLNMTGSEGDAKNYYGLSAKVIHMLGQQLEQWSMSLSSAANYHPPCFDIEGDDDESVEPPSTLAHVYFLSLLDHIRLTKKFEKQQRSHLRILDMLQSKERPTADFPFMHAIEKQVLLHVFTKQLSVALLDDKQAKQIDDAVVRKGLLTALREDQFCLWHKQLLMNMIMRSNSSEKTRKRLQEKVNSWFAVTKKADSKMKEHMWCRLQSPWTYEEMKSFVTEQNQAKGQRDNPHILLLHRLMDSYEKLNAGLNLIPILMQYCSKLKKHLDFKLHEKDATTVTLKAAIDRACSEMKSSEEKKQLRRDLYNEFVEKFNKYQSTLHMSTLGKTRRQDISGDTPLMNIFSLTVESKSAVNQALDEICDLCNNFIGNVQKCAKKSIPLLNWVILDQPPANLLQYHDAWQLLSRPLDQESLMSCFRRCLPVVEREVNFEQLSAEVIKSFFFGLSVSHVKFDQLSAEKVFRLYCKSAVRTDHAAATEYLDVCTQLRAFPRELDIACRKDVFAHFHGINHRMLQSVVDGLLMIAHHLTQAEDALHWANYTLSQFIQDIDESHTVKDFINLPRDMPGVIDLHFLEVFQVGNLLGALNLLVSWLETGFCNFHTLPLGVKKEMPDELVQCMEEKAVELKEEQKTSLLVRLEESIPPEVMGFGMGEFDTSAFEHPLKLYLKEHRICKSENLLQCIPEEVQLKHYVYYLILIRRVTEEDRLPTSNEGMDVSDSEEEEVEEPESEEEVEEEEQQSENMEEEVLVEDGTEKNWEQHSDGSLADDDSLNIPSRSNPNNGHNNSSYKETDEHQKTYDAGMAEETVSDRQMLQDSASSLAAVLQVGKENLTTGEYESEDVNQSASENESTDDSDEERYSMYETVSAQQSQSRLPSQSPNPQVHQSASSDGTESFPDSKNDSANEFLSASEGGEEMISPHKEPLVVKEGLHVTQKQLAEDLPHHQIQDTEDMLEQVINLPKLTQAEKEVSQSKGLSEQEEMPSSAWIEEASPSAQLPGPSLAAGIKMSSSTMQVNQPEPLADSPPVTVSDVCEWVKKIGMSQYADMFAEEGVDGQVLLALRREDLPDLGIEKPLHQTKLLVKINELKKKIDL